MKVSSILTSASKNKNMSKKLIQFSTKQCGRCQVMKNFILENHENKEIEYEYISLFDSEDEVSKTTINEYWDQVYSNFEKYTKLYNTPIFRTLPSFILIEDGKANPIYNDRDKILKLIK